jgi:hypothetical protein
MTPDPKGPFEGKTTSKDKDAALDAADATLTAGASDSADVVMVDEDADKKVSDDAKETSDGMPEAQPERQQSSSGGRGLAVFLVVVLSLAAAAVGAALGPRLLNPDAGDDLAAMQVEIAALKTDLEDLKTAGQGDTGQTDRLDALEKKVEALEGLQARIEDAELAISTLATEVPTGDADRLDALAARVDSLEVVSVAAGQDGGADPAAGIGSSDELAVLRDRARALIERLEALPEGGFAALDGLEGRLAAMEAATDANTTALDKLAGMDAAVAELRGEVTALAASLDAFANRAVDPGSAFVLSASQLAEAVMSGNPYQDHLAATNALAPDDPTAAASLQALAPHAATGVVTAKTLSERLPDAASAAVTAEHVATSEDWIDKTLSTLEGLVSVRRLDGDVEGSHAEAVTARAQARFDEGDLQGAVTELEGLSEAAGQEMASWIADAKAHLEASQALDTLRDRAIALVGGGAN